MKKILLLVSGLVSGLLNAQTYPFSENFDAMPSGAAPTGTWYVMPNGFKVMANHGHSVPNALATEMKSTHTADTLISPLIGPLTSTSVMYIDYRIVNAALYPANATVWGTSDKIYVDAYINSFSSWQSHVATIDNTNYVQGNTYTTYSYGPNALLNGQVVKLRVSTVWGAGDYFVDIDNFNVMNQVGVKENNANSLSLMVYPNPARENFTVAVKNNFSNKPLEVSFYNALGQVVKTVKVDKSINSNVTISTAELTKGIYLVEVKSDNDISQTKLVVE
ncbi:MAG TPA: T9SS type A sorting domain-containing protein [Bacteroidia bacterium]|jgi:hypothetical protein|nr:T9SS type A sorting domain-containing protein [Bacteroidia bacterium]